MRQTLLHFLHMRNTVELFLCLFWFGGLFSLWIRAVPLRSEPFTVDPGTLSIDRHATSFIVFIHTTHTQSINPSLAGLLAVSSIVPVYFCLAPTVKHMRTLSWVHWMEYHNRKRREQRILNWLTDWNTTGFEARENKRDKLVDSRGTEWQWLQSITTDCGQEKCVPRRVLPNSGHLSPAPSSVHTVCLCFVQCDYCALLIVSVILDVITVHWLVNNNRWSRTFSPFTICDDTFQSTPCVCILNYCQFTIILIWPQNTFIGILVLLNPTTIVIDIIWSVIILTEINHLI